MTAHIENYLLNGENGSRRGRARRAGAVVAALAGAALLTAACGGAPNTGQAGGGGQDRHAQAVSYAKCMRDNGDPAWPDPNSGGSFTNNNGSLDRTSAAYMKAAQACKSMEPNGAPPAVQLEATFQKLLKYSKCMRDNGVTKFPDPVKQDGGVGIEMNKDVDSNSAAYKNAQKTCQSLQLGPS
jgi:hypothetical protein